jgi:hypothetical protein
LHYIAENIQDQLPVHDFIAKEWNKNWSRFWEMAKKLWYFTVLSKY